MNVRVGNQTAKHTAARVPYDFARWHNFDAFEWFSDRGPSGGWCETDTTDPEIVAEDLPAYAPEANPDEWVWNWTKYGRLSNLAAQDADELWDWVVESLIDLKFRPDLLAAFLHDAELPLAA